MTQHPSADYKKKLIEVAMPLDAINKASTREKSIRHGHPSTLHLWWSRKPLATARAVIWASLVDDPSAHPDEFPTEEAQQNERERLFGLLEKLVVWENSNDKTILAEAKAEIHRSMGENLPEFLDPFAGGGSLPLEAQRLGLKAHAQDLNPVAVMMNKAMIELPGPYVGTPPVNPEAKAMLDAKDSSKGTAGLAADIRYYGNWMREEAKKRIGNWYPPVQLDDGTEAPAIAWLWNRTVACPNPACNCTIPLASSFNLCTKKGKEVSVKLDFGDHGKPQFTVVEGKSDAAGTIDRKGAVCPHCGSPISFDHIRTEGKEGRINSVLSAVVAEGTKGRKYCTVDSDQTAIPSNRPPINVPRGKLPFNPRNFNTPIYGLDEYWKLFTSRQLAMLTTFSDLVGEAAELTTKDAQQAGIPDPEEYGKTIATYLAFVVDKLADYHSSLCSWHISGEKIRNTFGRQAIPMVWDYAEANPFSNSSGSYSNMLDWIVKAVAALPSTPQGTVSYGLGIANQKAAQEDAVRSDFMISTDPPYYDNVNYADLSDYFYVWLRRSLRDYYPEVFETLLTPKREELIANPYRFDGNKVAAKEFFENGMLKACRVIYDEARDDLPVTVYYAYKQKQDGKTDSGWATMLTAILQAGFQITGTWPIRTEMANRQVARDTNALASSVVLVCRKRPKDAIPVTRREFVSRLRRELPKALSALQASNIAPVDMAQSAIGPGMAIFSEYSEVFEPSGEPMSVDEALKIINEELDSYLTEQEGALDEMTRFCVDLYSQHAFDPISFGEADVLARAKNTSVDVMASSGLLEATKGKVRLLPREELSEKKADSIWMLTQKLTHAMQEGGIHAAAEIVAHNPVAARAAKDLAYRLYSTAEKKKWQREALAYNGLVSSWTQVLDAAAAIQEKRKSEQLSLL